jgi:dTMP kinase
VAALVRPALADGQVVISDRYVDSSLAYQGAGRTLPVNEVSWLSAWATGGLKPDLVVLLDIDPAIGLMRVGDRGAGLDRLEGETLPFHERVRYAFLDLAADEPARYLVMDASRSPDAVAAMVADRVRGLLPPPPTREAAERPAATETPDTAAGPPSAEDATAEALADVGALTEGPVSTVESR